MAFSLSQVHAVCLPLLSDNQLIWVHSNEINLQPDGGEELHKAFTQFPYLSEKQTAALALRCSLHPDQVKVWFMFQRLRYGVSWDNVDISKIQRMYKSNRKEGREESEGGVMGNVRADEQTEGKVMQEDSKVEDKGDAQNKETETGKKRMRRGRAVDVDEGESQATLLAKKKKRVKVIDKTQLDGMKTVFLHSQYPSTDEYTRLVTELDVPRPVLIKWFHDMRYYVKKIKPRWMRDEEYAQALANINYRQYRDAVVKLQSQITGWERPGRNGGGGR